MKKTLVFLSAGLLAGAMAYGAGDLEHNVGQGLGTMIFQGQDGLVQQVLAATTNGTFGNQTFAITSGTLGARQAQSLVMNETMQNFVAGNLDNLARDIAMGKGECLDTLAALLEVQESDKAAFNSFLRQNFDRIYPDASVTSDQVLKNLANLIS